MSGDETGSDISSEGGDFLAFQWNAADDIDGDPSTSTIRDHDGLLEEISRLEIDASEGTCGDSSLHSVVQRVGSPLPCQLLCNDEKHANDGACGQPECIVCSITDLRRKNGAILHYMGTMAQCRGARGDALREAGAIDVLLGILWRLMVPMQKQKNDNCSSASLLPAVASESDKTDEEWFGDGEGLCNNHLYLRNDSPGFDGIAVNALQMTALDAATSCLGSLRDLACGSAANRAAILAWTPPSAETGDSRCIENGVHLLSAYVQRYERCQWEQILYLSLGKVGANDKCDAISSTTRTERGKKELRILTNALGVVRNASHSTPDVCQEFFIRGLVDTLVGRLIPDDGQSTITATTSSLPDVSSPWREACFRAAGSLINLAEKCPAVARQLGSNKRLIYLLIEAWGGTSAVAIDPNNTSTRGLPLLHLGLAAVLHAAGSGALDGGLDDVMEQVLEREKLRKRAAQRQEEERKLQQAGKRATREREGAHLLLPSLLPREAEQVIAEFGEHVDHLPRGTAKK